MHALKCVGCISLPTFIMFKCICAPFANSWIIHLCFGEANFETPDLYVNAYSYAAGLPYLTTRDRTGNRLRGSPLMGTR